MKKWIALGLSALMLCTAVLPASAAEKKGKKETILPAVVVASDLAKNSLKDSRSPVDDTLTTDDVSFDEAEGTVTVDTASGISMQLSIPFGYCCITQDLEQQLDVYLNLYTDVASAVKHYITNGIHMDVYDYYSERSVYISEEADSLAALTGEMNTLTDEQIQKTAEYMSANWYGGASPILKTIGENRYIGFDLSKDEGFVVYNHITGGRLFEAYTHTAKGSDGIKLLDSVLETLTFPEA